MGEIIAGIGLASAVVDLSKNGFQLIQSLNRKVQTYRNAPKEILEISHDVLICYELMGPFGEDLRTRSVKFTQRFQVAVEALVKNSHNTFDEVKLLLPKDGVLKEGAWPRWKFVLDKSKIEKHRRELREHQHKFISMRQMMLAVQPVSSQHQSVGARGVPGGGGFNQFPTQLSGEGTDENGNRVMYHATISMRPFVTTSTFDGLTRDDEKRKLRIIEEKEQKMAKEEQKSSALPQTFNHTHYLNLLRQISPELLTADERRSSLASSESSGSIDAPDEYQAEEEVDYLLESWFGPDSSKEYPLTPRPKRSPHQPSLAVPDTSTSTHRSGSTSPKSPTVVVSPSTSPKPPKSPKEDLYRCNACNKEIKTTRFECQRCKDYDLCRRCFDNPEVTLKHRHAKSYFEKFEKIS